MFLGNYQVRHRGNGSGKFEHVPHAGLHHAETHGYREHHYEICRREVGLTVKRTTYSATILGEHGEFLNYLADLPNLDAAQKAAKKWIDTNLQRLPKHLRKLHGPHRVPPAALEGSAGEDKCPNTNDKSQTNLNP